MPQAFVTLFCEAIKAVLRTLSGVRFCSPGKRSATGGRYTPHSKKPRTFRDGVLFKRKNKKPGLSTGLSALFDAWQFPTLTWGDPTLPSALRRFTSEFGMGSGGTTALVPPGKFFVLSTQFFIASAALPALVKSVTYFSMLLPLRRLSPCCCANYCVLNSESKLKTLSNPPKHLRRCKVKPHGSLVPVSSTHRCAYTPGLSTSSSSTFLQET